MDVSAWFYPVLFLTGIAAGFVDSIAGGGGLLTLPVLLSAGLSPQDALATNKLQATFGSGSATWHFARAGLVRVSDVVPGIICAAVGATAGTLLVRQVDPAILRVAIPWMLIAIAVYLLARPEIGSEPRPPRLASPAFHVAFGLLIGFYDGVFGPGTGTFWAMAYVLVLGFSLTKATAHTKLMNFSSNVASLTVFALAGNVLWLPGAVMGVGQALGARLGSRAVIKRGAKIIRPIFLIIVLAIAMKLLWDFRNS
ncbi:MAG: TSUP family transporter [Verrucomicrobia subdivision 3 bacterium]|nr:TSUP family transporter [Limisphaerales bacterium]